jgi:DNA ligase-1
MLVYPKLVSPKLDGIRCLLYGGIAVSRNLKPIRNKYVQEMLSALPDGLDGELIVGSPTEGNVLNRTTSGIMSEGGEPDFKFYVFDDFKYPGLFYHRYQALSDYPHPFVHVVPHKLVHNELEFAQQERVYLKQGYEGIMSRSPNGHYKYGRSTHQEQILHKFKQFTDSELLITHILEGQENGNEQTRDALGDSVRSTAQAGMVPNGRVGTICGTDVKTGQALEISPGRMTHDMRQHYWEHPEQIVGKIANYKFFGYGNVAAPRFATFQAFRELGI